MDDRQTVSSFTFRNKLIIKKAVYDRIYTTITKKMVKEELISLR